MFESINFAGIFVDVCYNKNIKSELRVGIFRSKGAFTIKLSIITIKGLMGICSDHVEVHICQKSIVIQYTGRQTRKNCRKDEYMDEVAMIWWFYRVYDKR